jgi:hypothetical protein
MKTGVKPLLKDLLGEMPLAAETYWYLRQQDRPVGGLHLNELQARLGSWRAIAAHSPYRQQAGRRITLFATLGYWIQHCALVGLSLAALGHEVSLAYLPYASWQKNRSRFDLRQQNVYVRSVLSAASPLMQIESWYTRRPERFDLPADLQAAINRISGFDVMYTDQVETVDRQGALYNLRLERNTQAAGQALARFQARRPDLVLLPNGSILEFGAVYQAARSLQIPVVTYEFGEQRDRIWFARDEEVMRQNTDALWQAFRDQPLQEDQWQQVRELFAARQKASLWENFSRRWQDVPSQGAEKTRQSLALDRRPVTLLPANVIGDSLTLGRQVFSDSMTDWLERTVAYFAQRPDIQLVVRIHPGERYTQGPSVAQVVQQALPELPEHVHLVAHDAPVNTYDLIQTADLGLVYTTTVGMEMAMSGVPVVVAGQTHYRARGFTHDPDNWEGFFQTLEQLLEQPGANALTRQQVESAWNYAYRFFFEYPMPFPWHLLYVQEDTQNWPLERVLSEIGQASFAETFRYLGGEMRNWS